MVIRKNINNTQKVIVGKKPGNQSHSTTNQSMRYYTVVILHKDPGLSFLFCEGWVEG